MSRNGSLGKRIVSKLVLSRRKTVDYLYRQKLPFPKVAGISDEFLTKMVGKNAR